MDLQIDPVPNQYGAENGKVGFTVDDYQYFKRVYEYNPGAKPEEIVEQVFRETNVQRSVIVAELQRLEAEKKAAEKPKRGRPPKVKDDDKD